MVDDTNQTIQTNDWLKELRLVRDEAQAQRSKNQSRNKAVDAKSIKIRDVLKELNGLEFLRDIQKEVLNGQGLIEQLEDTGKYERALALTWDGSIITPSRPKETDKAQNSILIGVANNQLFVNEELVSPVTSQALQKSLLEAIRDSEKLKTDDTQPEQNVAQPTRKLNKKVWGIVLGLLFIIFVLIVLGNILLATSSGLIFFG